MAAARLVTPEPLSASGRNSEKLSLPALQSKMKIDPEGYETELGLIYTQFDSALDLYQQQAALNFGSTTSSGGVCADPTVSKNLGDRAMFLAHMTPFYPKHLAKFPSQLAEFLKSSARSLPSGLRGQVTQALILLINRQAVEISETLGLFMELQTLGDRNLRKLAFSHVIQSIKRMNKNHKNMTKNKALQNILFSTLQQEDEAQAKRALVTLCELHRRKVWFDDRTANAICTACFHSSSRIMISAISFLLDYEKIEDVDTDSDASSSDDESKPQMPVVLNKEAVYKALHKGTAASKRKKKAKLERALRNMKRQQRTSSENSNSTHYSPLNHLIDAQGFAEKLFSRLQTCSERFEIRMMMLKVLARTVGLHRLILLNLYPYLQRYVQPHQRDITSLLAAAIQACHDMVPPDAVEPLFKQIVNQFVHDGSRPEAIAVGLNVTREICLRMPLLMTEDLLQDLVLYKKSHEKAVSVAARSLMTLFREICPSLLVKKDRGRPSNPKTMPKAYGEVNVISNVPGLELLKQDIEEEEDEEGEEFGDIDDSASSGSEDDNDNEATASSDDEENQMHSDDAEENSDLQDDSDVGVGVDDADDYDTSDAGDDEENEEVEAENEDDNGEADEEDQEEQEKANSHGTNDNNSRSKPSKRKFSVFNEKIISAETSLRALKRLAEEKSKDASTESADGILSNEDFRRIKELKAKEAAKFALSQQGFKLLSSDGLSAKRVDPAKLEVHVRKRLSKEEKLAIVKAGREETGQYRSRTSIKKKKTGGLSNREKEHKKQKRMPSAAIKSKIVKSRLDKQKKQQRSGKQFRGRKAWK